jgi:periplasmic divalent cation tolerance protein
MIVKTRATLGDAVRDAIKASHSYSTPAILVIPIESVEKTYLGWLLAETEEATHKN